MDTNTQQEEIQVIKDTVNAIKDDNTDKFPLPDRLDEVSLKYSYCNAITYFVYSACVVGLSIMQTLGRLRRINLLVVMRLQGVRVDLGRGKRRKRVLTRCEMSSPTYMQTPLRWKLTTSVAMPPKGLLPGLAHFPRQWPECMGASPKGKCKK
jgi:hypothetical protein